MALLTFTRSKFFTQPNGAKKPAPTQQTKLSFSTKPSNKTEKKPAVDEADDAAEVTPKEEEVATESAKVKAEPAKGS
jgi:DNA ligase 1